MIPDWLSRTEKITGSGALERLAACRVAVFGLGGVGGHCAEALARSGIGALDIIDMDTVEDTNRNRQLAALVSTVGRRKTDVLRERILDINPECRVTVHDLFYLPETASAIDLSVYDYVADAIDNMTAKLFLAEETEKLGIPLIAGMGTGNRLDPSKLCVTDIAKTHDDPLAKNMRVGLRKRGIEHLDVVWSAEIPVKTGDSTPGSTAFVPAAAGLLMASFIARRLMATGDGVSCMQEGNAPDSGRRKSLRCRSLLSGPVVRNTKGILVKNTVLCDNHIKWCYFFVYYFHVWRKQNGFYEKSRICSARRDQYPHREALGKA